MCKWLRENGFTNTPLHFSRFHPVFKLEQLPPTPIEVLDKAYKIALEEGIKYVYIGNVPGNEASNTKCPWCNAVIVERAGYRIASFRIKNGKCAECGKPVDGVWN
jgi:pyruvate formate lyase activating enzyme